MRPVRFGAAALALLLAGCQAGDVRPVASASPPQGLSATAPSYAPNRTPTIAPSSIGQAVSSNYNPKYCGVRQAGTGEPAKVLLTIDDFPYRNGEEMVKVAQWAQSTHTLMEAFPVSSNVSAYDKSHHTDLVARTRALGTYVGNHTFSHADLRNIPLQAAEREIMLGVPSTTMRPPYGDYNRTIRTFVEQDMHARICYWTLDTKDWQKLKDGSYPSVDTLLSRVSTQLEHAQPGAPVVILGHYFTNYPKALPAIRRLVIQVGLRVCRAPNGPTTAEVPYPIC